MTAYTFTDRNVGSFVSPKIFERVNYFTASGEIIYQMTFHTAAQKQFEIYPRKVRELHIVFEYLLESLIPKHYFLR